MKTGEKIRQLRNDRGETQTQLAKSIGVSYEMICYYEKGRQILPLNRAKQIAEHYGVDFKELLSNENLLDYCISVADTLKISYGKYMAIRGTK